MESFIILFQKSLSNVIGIQSLIKPMICPHLIYSLLGRETTNKQMKKYIKIILENNIYSEDGHSQMSLELMTSD